MNTRFSPFSLFIKKCMEGISIREGGNIERAGSSGVKMQKNSEGEIIN